MQNTIQIVNAHGHLKVNEVVSYRKVKDVPLGYEHLLTLIRGKLKDYGRTRRVYSYDWSHNRVNGKMVSFITSGLFLVRIPSCCN